MARRFIDDRRAGPMGEWGSRQGEAFRALCTDGKVRVATVTAQDADSFFSIRARVQVRGKSVSGFVMGMTVVAEDSPTRYEFIAYQNRKNAGLLPGI